LFVYVFAMWHWNRDLQQQKATRELQQKIVAWIDRQAPRQGGYTWDDLTRALIVTQEDADFLDRQGYEYRPLEPGPQPDQILFLQKKGENEERFVYKDGSHGYERRWPSPDGKHILIDLRGPEGSSALRTLRFLALGEPGVLGEYVVDGYQRTALWNSTGDLVAMKATLVDSQQPIVVFRLAKAVVEVVEWPEDLTLADLLSREVQHMDAKWSMEFMDARGWPAPNTLQVHFQGTGSYTDRASGAKNSFNLIYEVLLELTPRNQCRIKSRSKRHFAASEFR
jgi:hypothetical protein